MIDFHDLNLLLFLTAHLSFLENQICLWVLTLFAKNRAEKTYFSSPVNVFNNLACFSPIFGIFGGLSSLSFGSISNKSKIYFFHIIFKNFTFWINCSSMASFAFLIARIDWKCLNRSTFASSLEISYLFK